MIKQGLSLVMASLISSGALAQTVPTSQTSNTWYQQGQDKIIEKLAQQRSIKAKMSFYL
jgi:hypothetical protein